MNHHNSFLEIHDRDVQLIYINHDKYHLYIVPRGMPGLPLYPHSEIYPTLFLLLKLMDRYAHHLSLTFQC